MKDEDPEFDEDEFGEDDDDIGPFGTNCDNLEGLARHALSRLNSETRQEIDVQDYPELEELIMELSDAESAYNSSLAQKLSFQPSVISKFLKLRGKVRTHVARKLADRLRTYVRSTEQDAEPVAPKSKPPSPPATEAQVDFVVAAVEWKFVKRTDELQNLITELVRLINDVTRHMVTCNLPESQRAY